MKVLLSGEGSTDIGVTRPTVDGQQFVPGPMAWFVDRLLEPRLGYSILDLHEGGADCVRHASAVPKKQWQQKFDSIARGFELVEFDAGVPMVPRPKSEAWLLCALKSPPYQHCHALEDSPGNDGSPHALKARLATLHGSEPGADEQAEWVRTGRVDPAAIDMHSCEAFRTALDHVARAIGLGAAPAG